MKRVRTGFAWRGTQIILFGLMVQACATGPTRPAVDASLYLFELEVTNGPELGSFDPNVAKGRGDGLMRGAGIGAGSCIYAGLQADAESGGSTMFLGTVIGVLISPACALVGGVVGSGVAEDKEDVEARIVSVNTAALELGYPDALAPQLDARVRANPIYHIADGEGAPATEVIAEAAQVLETADDDVTPPSDAIPGDETSEADTDPLAPPTTPNGSIHIQIKDFGFLGGGIDPKLPLYMVASLCVTDYHDGTAMAAGPLTAQSPARRLEDWAELGKEGIEDETSRMINQIATAAQQLMGRQVPLTYKASCR